MKSSWLKPIVQHMRREANIEALICYQSLGKGGTKGETYLVKELAAEAARVADEDFKARMKEQLKERGDMFDAMVEHEEGIRLGEAGWKARYYKAKLGAEQEEQGPLVRDMVRAFVEGLCWVMRYYYDGALSTTLESHVFSKLCDIGVNGRLYDSALLAIWAVACMA